jgi:hypothetical protein
LLYCADSERRRRQVFLGDSGNYPRETPFHENGQTDRSRPLCRVGILVKWPLADTGSRRTQKLCATRHPPPLQIMDAGALRAARISSRPLAVATTDNALLAPEPAAGRHKRSRTPADITTTKGTPARRGGAHR